jgi:putative oxidoreductase
MDTSHADRSASAILEITGKLLISALFWWDGILHGLMTWPDVVDYVAARGFPIAMLVGAGATAFQILVPASLFVRRLEPWACLALAGYCVLTALVFHNFWTLEGDDRIGQQIQFLKNMALSGALLVILARSWPTFRHGALV